MGVADRRLHSLGLEFGRPQAARASDGRTFVVWRETTDGTEALLGRWFGADWGPLGDPPTRLNDAGSDPREYNVAGDSAGRGVAVWLDLRSSAWGIYCQIMDSDGSRGFPSDRRVDRAPPGVSHHDPAAVALPGGLVGIGWIDDREGVGSERVHYSLLQADGSPVAPDDEAVDPFTGIRKAHLQLVHADPFTYAVFAVDEPAPDSSIGAVVLSGLAPLSAVLASDPYPWIIDVVATIDDGNGLVIVWATEDGPDNQRVLAQRFSGGVPQWGPATVSSTAVLRAVVDLGVIDPGPDRVAVTFSHLEGALWSSKLQELDLSGGRRHSSDVPLLAEEPLYRSYGGAVSRRLNDGGSVRWAVLEATDEENDGVIDYFFLGDGGATWQPVQSGLPIVFDAPAADLRWGADLWTEPTGRSSPHVNELRLLWDEPGVAPDLVLNRTTFRAGDLFDLRLRLASSGSFAVEEYVILDVYGSYWFWPGWTPEVDRRTEPLAAGTRIETILQFIWPDGAGAATGIRVWAGVLHAGTSDLAGPIDYVEFSFL